VATDTMEAAMNTEPVTCPTCGHPGFVYEVNEERGLISHPGRHFPCRIDPHTLAAVLANPEDTE
jgi:hypothetical protein